MTSDLLSLLASIPPGPVSDTTELERLLAACWHELDGDDGGMEGHKLLGRMEEVAWNPPLLTFTIERHGRTLMGSSRATLQEWWVDLDRKTVWSEETRTRQVRPMQRRLDVKPLAEEITQLVVRHTKDERLQWYADGRVKVLVGKILPERSACKQTLIARRKRFRIALEECLEREGWELCGFWYTYSQKKGSPPEVSSSMR